MYTHMNKLINNKEGNIRYYFDHYNWWRCKIYILINKNANVKCKKNSIKNMTAYKKDFFDTLDSELIN
jgi:hypothetical protein